MSTLEMSLQKISYDRIIIDLQEIYDFAKQELEPDEDECNMILNVSNYPDWYIEKVYGIDICDYENYIEVSNQFVSEFEKFVRSKN